MKDYWTLIRPRIVAMVLFAMAVAAWTAGSKGPSWAELTHALAGTALVIVGAVALNQRLEISGDARMPRTTGRPLPSGRLTRAAVTRFGLLVSALGLAYLVLFSLPGVVALAVVSWAVYVWAYTPLKSRSAWQTPVGAAAGAMPMLLGAAVVRSPMSPMALSLFGIVYSWQFPHAMAIAWLYREQFATAEVKLATVVDPSGRTAGWLAVAGSMLLLTVSMVPSIRGLTGWRYNVPALILGYGYMACSFAFLRHPDDRTARRLFWASVLYLPLLLAALLVERT